MASKKEMTPRVAYILLKAQIKEEPFLCFKHDGYYIFDCTPRGEDARYTRFFAVDEQTGKAVPYSPYGDGIDNFNKFVESAAAPLRFK